jgi:hypothetical protein
VGQGLASIMGETDREIVWGSDEKCWKGYSAILGYTLLCVKLALVQTELLCFPIVPSFHFTISINFCVKLRFLGGLRVIVVQSSSRQFGLSFHNVRDRQAVSQTDRQTDRQADRQVQ